MPKPLLQGSLSDATVGLRPHLEGVEDALDTAAFLAELLETWSCI